MFEKPLQIEMLESDKYALVGGLVGIIDSAMDAIITINEAQRILFFNPAAEQMFGCKAAEALGSRVDRFIPKRFRKAHKGHIRKFGQTGETSRRMGQLGEIRGLRTNGEEFPIEASISQVSVGGTKLFSVILRDITERKRAEEALKESQKREQTRRIELETLMETVPLPVWVSYDRDCKIMTGNKAAYELTNLPVGANISETAPDGRPHFNAYKDGQPVTAEDLPMQKAARTGNPTFNEELEFCFIDGRSKWVYGNVVPLRDENGNIYGALGAFMDVTQRKQMETAIATSERKFRAIYEQAPLAIALIDSKTGRFLQVNQKYCEITGRTQKELLELDFQTITHPDDLQADLNNMELLREGKIPYFTMEKRYIRPDNSIIWGALTVVPMWKEGESGNIHIAMVMDINESKKAEEALASERGNLQAIFDAINIGMLLLDDKGVVKRVNNVAARWRAKEIPTPDVPYGNVLGCIHALNNPAGCGRTPYCNKCPVKNAFETALRDNKPVHNVETKASLSLDGTVQIPLWLEVSADPLIINGKQHVVLTLSNITERKQAEEQLHTMADELARSNHDLEQFAYAASHDMQEPLRMVKFYVQLLAKRYRGKLDADADEFINFSIDGSTHMQQLIDGLLEYSRVGRGKLKLDPTDCNLIVQHALANLKVAIEESKAQIICDQLPTVNAESTQLTQLFQNLIGNAIKFRGEQPPQVRISASSVNGQWQFSVSDNGIGIDEQFKERIFIIFQRLHTREKYPGAGIGLAVCKKIVELHGGRIWLESELRKGTTFFFTIKSETNKAENWERR